MNRESLSVQSIAKYKVLPHDNVLAFNVEWAYVFALVWVGDTDQNIL